jgi:hypothetical protein
MAINFETPNPQALLAAFKQAIDQGHVVTWSYDAANNFTHTPEQWKDQAVMRPTFYQGWLVMNFWVKKAQTATKPLYGVYHGRFTESMLSHCDTLFSNATSTAMPTNADRVRAVA